MNVVFCLFGECVCVCVCVAEAFNFNLFFNWFKSVGTREHFLFTSFFFYLVDKAHFNKTVKQIVSGWGHGEIKCFNVNKEMTFETTTIYRRNTEMRRAKQRHGG